MKRYNLNISLHSDLKIAYLIPAFDGAGVYSIGLHLLIPHDYVPLRRIAFPPQSHEVCLFRFLRIVVSDIL